jgi:hypothetical protein
LLQPGQQLYFRGDRSIVARIKPDGRLLLEDGKDGWFEGSIHQAGRHLMDGGPCNGWMHWYYEGGDGEYHLIDDLRQVLRDRL